jgi:hypothetical protein
MKMVQRANAAGERTAIERLVLADCIRYGTRVECQARKTFQARFQDGAVLRVGLESQHLPAAEQERLAGAAEMSSDIHHLTRPIEYVSDQGDLVGIPRNNLSSPYAPGRRDQPARDFEGCLTHFYPSLEDDIRWHENLSSALEGSDRSYD